MPELPDVEGFRRVLGRAAKKGVVSRVEVRDRGILHGVSAARLEQALVGARLGSPSRHGKWLVVPIAGGGDRLALHFGMSGSLEWSSRPGEVHPHDRVLVDVDGGRLAFRDQRKLHGIWLVAGDEDLERVTGRLGPDALGLSDAALRARMEGRRARLKSVLMDQRVIAGVGNLTADETLWRARVHPARRWGELDERAQAGISRSLQEVLHASARRGHLLAEPGWLTRVREQPDARCPRCGARLQTTRIGGRTTVWCPSCQREDGPARSGPRRTG